MFKIEGPHKTLESKIMPRILTLGCSWIIWFPILIDIFCVFLFWLKIKKLVWGGAEAR